MAVPRRMIDAVDGNDAKQSFLEFAPAA